MCLNTTAKARVIVHYFISRNNCKRSAVAPVAILLCFGYVCSDVSSETIDKILDVT